MKPEILGIDIIGGSFTVGENDIDKIERVFRDGRVIEYICINDKGKPINCTFREHVITVWYKID